MYGIYAYVYCNHNMLYNSHPVLYNLQHRLNPPTPGSGNSSNARETKLHSLSRWDVIIEDLSSEEDDVATEE